MLKPAGLNFSGALFMKCADKSAAENMLGAMPAALKQGGSIPQGDVVFFTHRDPQALQEFAQAHPGTPTLLNPRIQRESAALIRAMQLATNWKADPGEVPLNRTLN